jgi:Flp pilus assembly protein TadD
MTLMAHMFLPEADVCFAEAARLAPDQAQWLYFSAQIALRLDPDAVVPLLRRTVQVGLSDPDAQGAARLLLAEELLERGRLDEAEPLLREEQPRAPRNPRIAYDLGRLALARGDDATAEALLKSVRDAPEARKKATAALAAAERARGDTAAAATLEREAAAAPDDEDWYDPLLQLLRQSEVGRRARVREAARLEREGQPAEAARLFLLELERERTSTVAMGAGVNLVHAGEVEPGLTLLREAVRLDPDDDAPPTVLADELFRLAEREGKGSDRARALYREAADNARRAAGLSRGNTAAHVVLGRSLLGLGETAAAVAALRNGVARRPEEPALHLALGEALLAGGDTREAEAALENARSLAPQDKAVAAALERLRQKKSPPPEPEG